MLIGHRIQSKTCRPTPWPALTSARDGLFSEPEGAPNDTGYMRKLVKSQSDLTLPLRCQERRTDYGNSTNTTMDGSLVQDDNCD